LNEKEEKMFPKDLPGINAHDFSRCEHRKQTMDYGKKLDSAQKLDAVTRKQVYNALWNDDVLRALEYYEVDVHVKNGTLYLYGHIVSSTSLIRIKNAVRKIPGIHEIIDKLVLDDRLTLEVATSLRQLEHTYACKFFTGASHGVVSLNGTVSDQNIKSLAEKCVTSNSNVRGVINNVRILGIKSEVHEQPFLQPATGEIIFFSDGISGVVKQVVIDPNNRRVIAMIIQGNFSEPRNILYPLSDEKKIHPEQLVVVPMKTVRYLTKASGFLYIKSNEKDQYQDFDPVSFYTPNWDWTPPFPYCPDDVLFPAEYQATDIQPAHNHLHMGIATELKDAKLREQLLANDSLGG